MIVLRFGLLSYSNRIIVWYEVSRFTFKTFTWKRSDGIDAVMRTSSVILTRALVNILAVYSILPFKSRITLAVSSSFGVDAEVLALQGLLGTLVHILASLPVRSEKHSIRTQTEYLKSEEGLYFTFMILNSIYCSLNIKRN